MQMKTRSPRVLASAKGHVTAVAALELQPGMGTPRFDFDFDVIDAACFVFDATQMPSGLRHAVPAFSLTPMEVLARMRMRFLALPGTSPTVFFRFRGSPGMIRCFQSVFLAKYFGQQFPFLAC